MDKTIQDYLTIYNNHGTSCVCDYCIQVHKWNQDIKQYEYTIRMREEQKEREKNEISIKLTKETQHEAK